MSSGGKYAYLATPLIGKSGLSLSSHGSSQADSTSNNNNQSLNGNNNSSSNNNHGGTNLLYNNVPSGGNSLHDPAPEVINGSGASRASIEPEGEVATEKFIYEQRARGLLSPIPTFRDARRLSSRATISSSSNEGGEGLTLWGVRQPHPKLLYRIY